MPSYPRRIAGVIQFTTSHQSELSGSPTGPKAKDILTYVEEAIAEACSRELSSIEHDPTVMPREPQVVDADLVSLSRDLDLTYAKVVAAVTHSRISLSRT